MKRLLVLVLILLCGQAMGATYVMDSTTYPGVTVAPCEFAAGYLPAIPTIWDVPVVDLGWGVVTIASDGVKVVEIKYHQDLSRAPTVNGTILQVEFLYRCDPNWTVGEADEGFYLLTARVTGEIIVTGHPTMGSAIASVTVREPADANGDSRVNVLDLILVRNRMGLPVLSADNWRADVNGDGRVDVRDLIMVRNRL